MILHLCSKYVFLLNHCHDPEELEQFLAEIQELEKKAKSDI